MSTISELLRPHILKLVPYSSARDEYKGSEGVFLDANENALGSVTAENYNRYPDPYQWKVKEKLAQIKGVKPSQIFLGNGSDEAIDLLYRAFCRPGVDNVLVMPPTYGMYEVSAHINDTATIKVPLTPDFQIDTEAVLQNITPHTKLLFICTPNNPSGNLLQHDAITTILEQYKGITIIDEAYIDFCPDKTFVDKLQNYPNLIIIQTFSKAWGLAGLRLGMAFASEEIIAILNKIKPPYNISLVTQQIMEQALDQADLKNKMVAEILAQREELAQALQQIAYVQHIFPSDANFLLVKMQSAKKVFDYLIDKKIIVRDRSKVILCDDCLRITVGTKAENEALLQQMRQYLPQSDKAFI